MRVEVQPSATHNEAAWADRLPAALLHLCSHWWARALRDRQHELVTTVPSRLRPGAPGVVLVNRARSAMLGGCAALRLHAGFNMNWCARTSTCCVRGRPDAMRL